MKSGIKGSKFFLAFFTFINFFSCKFNFNEPIGDFFKEYTETASVEMVEVTSAFIKDSEGYINVPSANDAEINFIIRNPQSYNFVRNEVFNGNLTFIGLDKLYDSLLVRTDSKTDASSVYMGNLSGFQVIQNSKDLSIIKFIISSELLTSLETASLIVPSSVTSETTSNLSFYKDISFSFNMKEPRSNRTFDGQSIKLRVNTAPAAVRNLTILKYNKKDFGFTSSDDERYVLAFNMPDISGIHRDINNLVIKTQKSELCNIEVVPDVNSSLALGIPSESSIVEEKFISAQNLPSSFKNYIESSDAVAGAGVPFAGKDADRAVYFITKESLNNYTVDNPCDFEIIVKDYIGFSAVSRANAYSLQLDPVQGLEKSIDELEENEFGYRQLVLKAPSKTNYDFTFNEGENEKIISKTINPDEISIYYIVYDSAGKIAKQGSGLGSTVVNLSSGKWRVESWAHHVGFVDSDAQSESFMHSGVVYVNQNYTGDIKDGGRLSPFTDFSKAFELAKDSGFDILNVCVQNDYNIETTLNIPDAYFGKKVVISGSNGVLKGDGTLINAANGADITFENIKIEGAVKICDGASVVLSKNTKISKFIVEYMAAVVLADDFVAGSTEEYSIETVNAKPAYGWKILHAKDSSVKGLSFEQANSFKLVVDGYYLGVEKVDDSWAGFIRISGVTLKVPDSDLFTVNFSWPGAPSVLSDIPDVSKGSVINAVVKYNDVKTEVSSSSFALWQENTCVLAGSNKAFVEIPASLYNGKYLLVYEFEYNGLSYIVQMMINVTEAE